MNASAAEIESIEDIAASTIPNLKALAALCPGCRINDAIADALDPGIDAHNRLLRFGEVVQLLDDLRTVLLGGEPLL